ncbi:hypothetical protein SAMN05192558_11473 [Actinokineospora alba]|uniref:Uncharacterized protein n=1 Tax=Actinokineospora alba TaxID=504798 RepID=A0A1H0VJ24_9PSEU|nr:SAVMC3_10250 family protein [Actinokineospora alba]TDP67689.1 hypothetical protein C8E96_3236 [Actinokineospora alba]SDJ28339.1 hypothetical protein SAMN05421871_11273 [Actinokineospora alba]SDP78450.1 hypothetical protein SAMN05192558_11473 [Actinokineospora alba]
MRELVYLSDRKLEQFLPALRSMWPRPKVNIKTPVLEIGVEPTPEAERSKLKQLARVIGHIERTARWYTDPGAVAGQWVHFEAPLNYLVLDGGPVPGMTLFVDRAGGHPEAGRSRLVLHCSGTHLRIEDRPRTVVPPAGQAVEPAPHSGSGAGAFTANTIDLLLGVLRAQPPATDGTSVVPAPSAGRHLPAATAELLRTIDGRTHPETAAWMAGYARITANFVGPGSVRHVIASPLYIEYALPPR